MIENKFGIRSINIEIEAKCFCPIGKDWYTNKFDIDIEPEKLIPDYCELDKWVKENINGKELLIEEAVSKLYNHIIETYYPYSCDIASYVDDATHSNVVVRI